MNGFYNDTNVKLNKMKCRVQDPGSKFKVIGQGRNKFFMVKFQYCALIGLSVPIFVIY